MLEAVSELSVREACKLAGLCDEAPVRNNRKLTTPWYLSGKCCDSEKSRINLTESRSTPWTCRSLESRTDPELDYDIV